MLGSSLLPRRWRTEGGERAAGLPRWYNRHITPVLQFVSSRACTHPIHTIVFVALLASTTYVGLLETSLFDRPIHAGSALGKADFHTLMVGSKQLRAGPQTGWKWQTEENSSIAAVDAGVENLALLTFVFPDSSPSSPQSAPPAHHVPVPENSSAKLLPPSSNPLSGISHDTTLAYSLPLSEAPSFLEAVQEITAAEEDLNGRHIPGDETLEERKWIMKAVKNNTNKAGSLTSWSRDAWIAFLDLIKNAETLDIIIMVLGYLSMHLTFVSLFLSMRRLGSNFWLAATVLFSSVFAFLFGLTVTMKLGVPINIVLLSEGLPFLVVTIGFEKPIILTKAVLSASLDYRRKAHAQGASDKTDAQPFNIHDAVRIAVKERGYEIVRDYCVEILILTAGAMSGVQGGLRQFCFLAAWILFFDCILLFTFYTAILTVKLEINRIKRHVAMRKALEDDGVSKRVAENVASSNDWPNLTPMEVEDAKSQERTIFGRKIRASSIPKFKVLMVSAFVLINLLNVFTIPFRHSWNPTRAVPGLSSVVAQPPMDPFKVAGNGLENIISTSKKSSTSVLVTVFCPIKYELQYPSIHYASPIGSAGNGLDVEAGDLFDGMGGRVVEGVLKSLEDPVLSKWIIVALAMSLVLNGYLFNAARWTIKDPSQPLPPPKANEVQVPPSNPPTPPNEPASNGRPRPTATRQQPPERPLNVEKLDAQLEQAASDRSFEDCERILKEKKAPSLTDEELVKLALKGKIPGYALEKTLENKTRAVKIRRALVSRTHATRQTSSLLETSKVPYENYDYDRVFGACCENVIGYLPLPLGVAGPLMIDGQNYFLPMATTEGVLVASTSRGCKAINAGGGAVTVVTGDGMTRGPCVSFDTLTRAGAAKLWLDSAEGQKVMRDAFNSTSRFARLQTMKTALAGTYLFIRFKTTTGDAMGMNMISKGAEHALNIMATEAGFDDMIIISLSGNYCTDKKPAAINWIDGRGKSVVAEAIIPADVVKGTLKTDVASMIELNVSKNFIGSAMAGSIGGFNAHAANVLTAMFLATGQDPAQNVESSQCITIMKNLNGNLHISVSMPCIEVGTLGGGTILEPQAACLDLLGVKGSHPTNPGDNARQLARIIAAGVLAGELSLCSALAAGHLVKAHMSHNRSAAPSRATTPGPEGVQTPTTLAMTSMKDAGKSER
ncbi:3-hydroxy-3-methylglutaryl-coenzyme A reductase [Rhizodiscina lignyota]|uniref:3-hydroxy-3-methylglutaryl coenzyme A reductase n=1 Tax=Rhizodiscina lignyota TaxID=1504668 RepID=A0A9P4I6I7_9PEZI|nr:3-hydroxy-3-methylglutaryl-coenzyme A reductase [Rhizodiscina lignyota]